MMEIKLYMLLNKYKYAMDKQQYKTIKGQIKAGDYTGAMKGIDKLWRAKHCKANMPKS